MGRDVRSRYLAVSLFFAIFVTLAALAVTSAHAVPLQLPYAGQLTYEAGGPFDGSVSVVARLHAASSGGSGAVWTENLGMIAVDDGVFQVVLGNLDPTGLSAQIATGGPLWLEFEIDSTVMSPRQQFLSVPYARLAGDAETLEGHPASDFAILETDGSLDIAGLAINGDSVIDDMGNWVGQPDGAATQTTGPLDLYVDANAGDDANDGLSLANAKRTIQGAVALIPPIVRHNVVVSVAAGTYRDGAANSALVDISSISVSRGGRIEIRGDVSNPSSVILSGDDAAAPGTAVTPFGIFVNNTRRVYLYGLQIQNFHDGAIYYHRGASGNVEDCIMRDNRVHGLVVTKFSDVLVYRTSALSNGDVDDSGNPFSGAGFLVHEHARGIIIDSFAGGPSQGNGIGIHAANHASLDIRSTSISDSTYDGILVQNHCNLIMRTSGTPGFVSSASNNGRIGIYVLRHSDSQVYDTTVSNNVSYGIEAHYVSTIYGQGLSGTGNHPYGTFVGYQSLGQGVQTAIGGTSGPIDVATTIGGVSLP